MIPAQSSGAASRSSKSVGQRVGVGLVDHGVLRVAPVDVPAGEARVGAEVLAAGRAEAADAAGVGQPGHPDPVALPPPGAAGPEPVDHADDLVARRHPGTARCKVALGQVEVRPAHAARPDAHPDLAGAGLGDGPLDPHQRVAVTGPGRSTTHACITAAIAWQPRALRSTSRWRWGRRTGPPPLRHGAP